MKAKTNKHEEYIKAHAAAIPQLEAAIQQLKVAQPGQYPPKALQDNCAV